MVAIAKNPNLKNDLIITAKGSSFGSTYVNAGMLRKQIELDALEREDTQLTHKASLLRQRMFKKKTIQRTSELKDDPKNKFQKKPRRTTTIWTATGSFKC